MCSVDVTPAQEEEEGEVASSEVEEVVEAMSVRLLSREYVDVSSTARHAHTRRVCVSVYLYICIGVFICVCIGVFIYVYRCVYICTREQSYSNAHILMLFLPIYAVSALLFLIRKSALLWRKCLSIVLCNATCYCQLWSQITFLLFVLSLL